MHGFKRAYEHDRMSGRYNTLNDEQNRERTVYSLAASKPFDAFDLAHRYWVLRPFLDAEYGSATFTGGGGGVAENPEQTCLTGTGHSTPPLARGALPTCYPLSAL